MVTNKNTCNAVNAVEDVAVLDDYVRGTKSEEVATMDDTTMCRGSDAVVVAIGDRLRGIDSVKEDKNESIRSR